VKVAHSSVRRTVIKYFAYLALTDCESYLVIASYCVTLCSLPQISLVEKEFCPQNKNTIRKNLTQSKEKYYTRISEIKVMTCDTQSTWTSISACKYCQKFTSAHYQTNIIRQDNTYSYGVVAAWDRRRAACDSSIVDSRRI
jgi:hypothetical protein